MKSGARRRAPGGGPQSADPVELLDCEWNAQTQGRWVGALNTVSSSSPQWESRRKQILTRLQAWYEDHPLEFDWGSDYRAGTVDPLGVSSDDFVQSAENPRIRPWVEVLRSLIITAGDLFDGGLTYAVASQVVGQLPKASRFENLRLGHMDYHADSEVDELFSSLCRDAVFETLRHVELPSFGLRRCHVDALSRSPWAPSLRSLNATEWLIDWEPQALRETLALLGRFEALERLMLYNNLHGLESLEALLRDGFPELRHLNLGSVTGVGAGEHGAFLQRLTDRTCLPKVEAIYLSGFDGCKRRDWDVVLGRDVPVFLHGRRVDERYPVR